MTKKPHLLQTEPWGQVKSEFGWTTQTIRTEQVTVQMLFRQLPLGLTIAYIPKGPAIDWADLAIRQEIITRIHLIAKQQRAIFLKIEPDIWMDTPLVTETTHFLTRLGFRVADSIQPQTTFMIDIGDSEEAILAAMKQKTRYNIRLAKRKGVIVRSGTVDDVATFYQLSQTTAERDGFGIHSLAYYQTTFNRFARHNQSTLLIAEHEGQPLAALMAFRQAETAIYFYGASSNEKRNLMPAYLIQWEAIRWAKAQGCTQYDLWGIPDADFETLEAEFKNRHDGLWGVYRFKRGFGGQYRQAIGAFDYVYQPWLYRLYRWWRDR